MTKDKRKQKEKKLNRRLAKNLKYLMQEFSLSQVDVGNLLEKEGIKIAQGTVSRYVNEPDSIDIPLFLVIAFCEKVNVSLNDFMRKDLSQEKEIQSLYKKEELAAASREDSLHKFLKMIFKNDTDFVFDIREDSDFSGILQTYYCYFYSTISEEKKVLEGTLSLSNQENMCKAEFNLKAAEINRKTGTPFIKRYGGFVVLSKKVECYTCILKGEDVSELCFINFRHIKLNGTVLDCRVAEVLTTSAGEDTFPTVHRMLISRDEIKPEDVKEVVPLLRLNSNYIKIKKQDMDDLAKKSLEYQTVADIIQRDHTAELYYEFLEKDFDYLSRKGGVYNKEYYQLLSLVRELAHADRYNKVSKRLDDNVRDMLLKYSYFTFQE